MSDIVAPYYRYKSYVVWKRYSYMLT